MTDGATWDGHYANRVIGNYIYRVENLVPNRAGGFAFITDGNGVSIDCLLTTYGYRKPVLVEGNLVVGCGGRGVHVFNSVNVDGIGNTGIGNLRTASPAIAGSCEFDGTTDSSVSYHGNLIFPLHSPNWRDQTSAFSHNVVLGGREAVTGSNIDRRGLGFSYLTGRMTEQQLHVRQDVTAFAPVRPDLVPNTMSGSGWQTLGVGRRPRERWAAGSLESARRT